MCPHNATYLHFPFCKPSIFYETNTEADSRPARQAGMAWTREINWKLKWNEMKILCSHLSASNVIECCKVYTLWNIWTNINNNWLISGYFIINNLNQLYAYTLRKWQNKKDNYDSSGGGHSKSNNPKVKWIELKLWYEKLMGSISINNWHWRCVNDHASNVFIWSELLVYYLFKSLNQNKKSDSRALVSCSVFFLW